ncbi:MAG: hypothetical protein J6R64_03095 [Lentisphaeria bacterium]|nr:hypothetical protein [Lentisphaeria bacterium]
MNLQPTLLEKRYLDLLARAERHLQENNLETATKEYLAAWNMAEQENGSTILLAELELRLARIMLLQHRPERAEKHIRRAVVFLQKTQSSVDEQLRDLQKIIAEQKAAGQQKERMP